MEEADGIRMRQLKICILAGIWSFIMTGCSALYRAEPLALEAESTKVYVEMKEETSKEEVPEVSDTLEVEKIIQESVEDTGLQEEAVEITDTSEESTEVMGEASNGETEPGEEYAYFDDALFIGDSRTAGLREYGLFDNSDFFATPGLSIYAIPKTKVTIHEWEDVKLEDLLANKSYGKIYLMLGMNELGYDFEQTVERYRTFVEELQEKQPQAKLYLCANLHVTIVRTENDDIFNNANINKMNEEIRKLAEEKELPYLDINILFDDENGNLNEEYTSDDSHVLGRYYEDWCRWLAENISE